ncbi:hypothetical protein PISMIDRAFT_679109, partial [Pisolithus microcarpus 441]
MVYTNSNSKTCTIPRVIYAWTLGTCKRPGEVPSISWTSDLYGRVSYTKIKNTNSYKK